MIGQGKSWGVSTPTRTINADNAKTDTIGATNAEQFCVARLTGADQGLVVHMSNTDDDPYAVSFTMAADGTPAFVTDSLMDSYNTNTESCGLAVGFRNPETGTMYFTYTDEGSFLRAIPVMTESDGSATPTSTVYTPSTAFINQATTTTPLGRFKALVVGKGGTADCGAVVLTMRSYTEVPGVAWASCTDHTDAAKDEQDITHANDNFSDAEHTSAFALDDDTVIHCGRSGFTARYWNFRHIAVSAVDGFTITSTDNRVDLGAAFDNWNATHSCAVFPLDSTRFVFAMRGDYTAGTGTRLWAGIGSISGTTITIGSMTELNDETTGDLKAGAGGSTAGYMFADGKHGIVTGLVVDGGSGALAAHQIVVSGTSVTSGNKVYFTNAGSTSDMEPHKDGLCRWRDDVILVPYVVSGTPNSIAITPVFLEPAQSVNPTEVDESIAYAIKKAEYFANSTSSFTCAGGTSDALFVVSWAEDGTVAAECDLTALTWDGQSLTQLGEVTGTNANGYVNMSVWYLLNPNAATANFTPTWSSGSPNRSQIAVWHYENVKQEAPYGFAGTVTDATPNAGVTTSGALAKSTVIATVANDDNVSRNWLKATDGMHMFSSDASFSAHQVQGFFSYTLDGSEVTFDWTDESAATEPQTAVAFCFRDSDQ